LRADWRGRNIDLGGRAVTMNGSSAIEASAAQSFVFMPEGAFVAGRIDDGFTLVKVQQYPGVEVFLENRPVGRTDRNGNLLVTGLESYVGNALSIDPRGLPIDAAVSRTTALVAPREGAGTVTLFEVAQDFSALATLSLPAGGVVPLGAIAAIAGTDRTSPVGYDGEVYLKGLAPGPNTVDVTWNGGRCTAVVDSAGAIGILERVGDVTCAP
jgi:outer membrane usher protein